MARSTVDNRLDPLHIGLPCTVGTSVGVGDLNTKGNTLAAKITLSHSLHLPSAGKINSTRHTRRNTHMIPNNPEKSKPFLEKIFIFSKLLAIRAPLYYNYQE